MRLRQRERWQRGLLGALSRHWELAFNVRYRMLGMVFVPYQWLKELMAPLKLWMYYLMGVVIYLGFIRDEGVTADTWAAVGMEVALGYGSYLAQSLLIAVAADVQENGKATLGGRRLLFLGTVTVV